MKDWNAGGGDGFIPNGASTSIRDPVMVTVRTG